FFFQAEDGIRDGHVTGVQTCALPIFILTLIRHPRIFGSGGREHDHSKHDPDLFPMPSTPSRLALTTTRSLLTRILGELYSIADRSEERRVGKECRSRWLAL